MELGEIASGFAIIAVGAFATAYLGDKFLDYAQKPRRAGSPQRTDGRFYYLQYDENGNIKKVSSNNPYIVTKENNILNLSFDHYNW